MSSDPQLKLELLKALDRAERYKAALKKIRKLVEAPRPIHLQARLTEIGETAVKALLPVKRIGAVAPPRP